MKQPAILGFYGESNTGKTTLIMKVIKKLTHEGFRVATVKLTDKKIGIDTKEKDTWKYKHAGAALVIFSSPAETDFLVKNSQTEDEIVQHISEFGCYDIVLVEGSRDPNVPKIRIGDIPERKNTLIRYEGDFDELVQMVKNEMMKKKRVAQDTILVRVDGKQIPLTAFPAEFIKKTITGMLRSLKGIDEIQTVEIRFTT